ncbi:MAG: hypothetical protein ABR616_15720 [Dermatophilaceae bacterium]|nr:hypothetical protein [Intrasporangiaceae bacterium]
MSEPQAAEDPTEFFRSLRDKLGIDFEDVPEGITSGEALAEHARALAEAAEAPPEPPVPDPEEVETQERYPGSKQALKPVGRDDLEDDDPVGEVEWGGSPRVYTLGGVKTEFYTIGALAKALRREVVTLRKWEQKGYMPEAPYRAPGKGTKQDRLYTRAHIEGMVKILRDEKLLNPRKKMRIDQTNFADKAFRLFDRLANKEN